MSILNSEKAQDTAVPFFAVGSAMVVCFVAIALTGKNPVEGYARLAEGAFGTPFSFGETCAKFTVLILTGLSVCIALKAGLFNIGAEGQLMVGAISAAYFGCVLKLPAWIEVPLVLVLVVLCSGLYGLVAGYLKARRGVHEVISTIMLNWVALNLIENWLVVGPLSATGQRGGNISIAGTAEISNSARLWMPFYPQSRAHIGIFIGLLAAAAVYVFLKRTRAGFEMRAAGLSPAAARCAGIDVGRRVMLAMFMSGACAGLAGAMLIMGTEFQYPGVFRTGYGYDGIAVALIGAGHSLGIVVAAFFFGALRAGATSMQIIGIHRSFADLMLGTAVLFAGAHFVFRWLWRRAMVSRNSAVSPPPGSGESEAHGA
jgi:ABC-type uncharacterized transport system permease subunit